MLHQAGLPPLHQVDWASLVDKGTLAEDTDLGRL